jgi:hypothetical protein
MYEQKNYKIEKEKIIIQNIENEKLEEEKRIADKKQKLENISQENVNNKIELLRKRFTLK